MSAKLIIGKGVLDLVKDPSFQQQWKALEEKTHGFSVLQSHGFVMAWYQQYHQDFEPILCLGKKYDDLVGLLFLAWHKTKNYVVHVGEKEAEYHGWLATPDHEVAFLRQSLKLLKEKYPIKKWVWEWIPPGLNIAALKLAMPAGISIGCTQQEVANWNFSHPQKLEKLLKSKSLKSKKRRFERRGKVVFEVIKDAETLKKVLAQVKTQYDFRQEGAYGTTAFEKDPNKEGLSMALFNAGAVHASVLWLNEKVLAFHLGVQDQKRVCMGLISYDPTEAVNSPGTLLIVELGKLLQAEGYQYLDLTPGTNSYKDRFANEYHTLYKPTLYFNTSCANIVDRVKRRIEQGLLQMAPKLGMKIAVLRDFRDTLAELPNTLSTRLRQNSIHQLLGQLCYKKEQLHIYKLQPSSKAQQGTIVQGQAFGHMLRYKDHQPHSQRRKLLQRAITKFSRGAAFFSVLEKEELLWYGWRINTKRPICINGYAKPVSLPAGVALCDFYVNATMTSPSFFEECLQDMLGQIVVSAEENTYLVCASKPKLSDAFIKKHQMQLVEQKTLRRFAYFFSWSTSKSFTATAVNKSIDSETSKNSFSEKSLTLSSKEG